MELKEVMDFLESKGSEQTPKIFKKHGAPSNFFGVKVGDMKPIQKVEVSMGDTHVKFLIVRPIS